MSKRFEEYEVFKRINEAYVEFSNDLNSGTDEVMNWFLELPIEVRMSILSEANTSPIENVEFSTLEFERQLKFLSEEYRPVVEQEILENNKLLDKLKEFKKFVDDLIDDFTTEELQRLMFANIFVTVLEQSFHEKIVSFSDLDPLEIL